MRERAVGDVGLGAIALVLAAMGVYCLMAPAFGLLYLTDGYHATGTEDRVLVGGSLLALTEAIAIEIVLSVALLRQAVVGAWPGRAFLFGWPAGAINLAAFAATGLMALVL